MEINLDRDLVFFDVETTGLNIVKDRILQLAMLRLHKNGTAPAELSMLINPGIPIGEEAMAIHGITPKDLANKPLFHQVAQKIWDFVGDADLAGYNSNRFDIPILMEEFARVGMDFDISKRRLIDVQRIFYKMEPRTLRAAYRFYCGQELTDAHDAMADVRATLAVFKGQLTTYEGKDMIDENNQVIPAPITNNIKSLHDFTNDLSMLDGTQRLRALPDGTVVFNFGKYNNEPVHEVFKKEPTYYNWMMERDFSVQVKKIIDQIWKEMKQKRS
jgi:DNA polymerase III subunit epsilon